MNRERWHEWLDELMDLAERENLHLTPIAPSETEVAVTGRGKKKAHKITHDFRLAPSSFKSEYQDDIRHLLRFRSQTLFLIPKWCLANCAEKES